LLFTNQSNKQVEISSVTTENEKAQADLNSIFAYLKNPNPQNNKQLNKLIDGVLKHSTAKSSEKFLKIDIDSKNRDGTVVHKPGKHPVSDLIAKFNDLSKANASAKKDLKKVEPAAMGKKSATIDLDKTDLESEVAKIESLGEHVLRLIREQEERYAKNPPNPDELYKPVIR
jgi:hypothetical protein